MSQEEKSTINSLFKQEWTRRNVLQIGSLTLIASALMTVWPITRYLSSRPTTKPTILEYKDESTLTDVWVQIPNSRVWLLHEDRGYTALLATCTHLGCEVKLHPDNLWHCPCHGSLYDLGGNPLSGPAPQPLARLAIARPSNDLLLIDLKKTVGMDVRVL